MPEWTFLTNHALVLGFLARHPRITAREVSLAIGITERATRKIIADLDDAGYIKKKREGRRIRYRINPDLPLRHTIHQDTAIGDFLRILGWKGRRRQSQASQTGEEGARTTA
ncbi:MAG: winged helix-turn-helix domain-containing protein [Chloroflexota bacterium]